MAGDRRRQAVERRRTDDEGGIALLLVLLAMMLLSALGIALALNTSAEVRIAATFGSATEVFHAADAALERALHDLSQVDDWSQVLNGSARSTFVDGPVGVRPLPDAARLDLAHATDLLNCGRTPCSLADAQMVTGNRPWGVNNPVWRLYAHGSLASLGPAVHSSVYVVVWVADDSLENDGQPFIDGDPAGGTNPGSGLLQVRAHAYGTHGARRVVEATLRRAVPRNRVLSWREVRQPS